MNEKKQEQKESIWTIIAVILFIIMLVYAFLILIDNPIDEKTCYKTFYENENSENTVVCFAHSLWKINFGRNVDCNCYYSSSSYLEQTEFIGGK